MKIFLNSKKRRNSLNKSDTDAVILKAQAERIEDLKRELSKVSAENQKLREREEGVSDALSIAKQKAKDYLEEAKIRFALECERLEGYRRQWTSYIKDLSSAKDLGLEVINTEKKLRECTREIQSFINDDLPFITPAYESFKQETERIKPIEAIIESYENQDSEMLMSDEELKGLIVQLLNKQ